MLHGTIHRPRRAIGIAAAALLACLSSGCEGVGIPATDDPYVKLAQADALNVREGRVMQARRVTEEAIALFAQRGDKAGLAQAYRELGLVALSGGLGDDPVILRDPRAPLAPRPSDLDNAETHLKHARELAAETDQPYVVANIDMVLGNVQMLRKAQPQGCPYYDQSIKDYRDAMARQPGAKLQLPSDAADPVEMVTHVKKQAGCP
jgi:hypothetical protein